MHIGYFNDRQELGFSCSKDIHAVKQLSDLKNILKNPAIWIIRKGKQNVILIFSKEVLVAVFIFLRSSYIKPNVDHPSFASSEVYESCVIKSDNLRFLTSPPRISDCILNLKRGSNELIIEEEEKLVKSILAKAKESDYQKISINKLLKKILKLIDPVISDQRFWKILSESGKPIESELPGPSEVRSTYILGPYAPDKQAKTRSRGSSFFFAEALPISNTRKLSPMQKRVQLKMAKSNFSNNLESSGLSENHQELSQNIQDIEIMTRLRRSQPLYSSQVLGDSFKYGGKQLERKAPRHLESLGISIEGKTVEEMAMEYKYLLEILLSKPNLVIREDGTLNKQERTINIGEPESRGIVSFENNPLYEDHHFISSYPISDKAFKTFKETGNIGSSPEEKKAEIDVFQKKQAEIERTTSSSFYSSLPEDARIGNQQLREAEVLKAQLEVDPNFQLTDKEKNLIQRAKTYQEHKLNFKKNNPDIDRDEF
jgi:hypothetical protein